MRDSLEELRQAPLADGQGGVDVLERPHHGEEATHVGLGPSIRSHVVQTSGDVKEEET